MAKRRTANKAPDLGPDVGFDGKAVDGEGRIINVRYRIQTPEEIGIIRMVAFNKEMVRVAYGHDIADVIRGHLKMKEQLNGNKLFDAVVELNNLMHRLGDINQERDAKLMGCTLFINTEDEDLTKVPAEADRNRKIQHWNDAGIPYSFFLRSLGTFSNTLRVLFDSTTRSSQASGEAVLRAPSATSST